VTAIEKWTNKKDRSFPQALVARTVKGYGLVCMENIPKFHFRLPTDEEMEMGNRYDGTCSEL
jgi:transketolase